MLQCAINDITHTIKANCQNSNIMSLNLPMLYQSQLAIVAKLVYMEIMEITSLATPMARHATSYNEAIPSRYLVHDQQGENRH